MYDYLKKVLELTKPYRFRFALGLFCGFLSGLLAPTLPFSLGLAVNTVFSDNEEGAAKINNASSSYVMLPNLFVATNGPILSIPGQTNPDAGVLHGAVVSFPLQAAVGDYTISVGQPNQPPSQTYTGIFTISRSLLQGVAAGTNLQAAGGTPGTAKSRDKDMLKMLPGPVRDIADKIVGWFRPDGRPSSTRKILAIALIPLSMLLRGVLAYLNIYMLSWVGIRATNDLKVKLFSHLVNMPMSFFNKHSTGDLMARLDGTMAVSNIINTSFATIIREPITILTLSFTVVSILWSKQPLLSVLILIGFPICLIPVVIYGRKLRKSHSGIYAKFASVANLMHESFTGMRVIKGYNLESTVVGEFRRATEAVTAFFMRAVRASEVPGPLIEFIGSIGVSLVFVYFAFRPGGGTVASMLMLFGALFQMYAPLKNLSRLHSQMTLARASLDPVYDLLAIQSTLPEPAQPKPLQAHGAPIRFENVSFSYGEKPVLHNINLTIRPGQLVALVGPTGSGKTSIANLLLRFYDPQSGAVYIGDTDIRAVSSRDLRASIAVVSQETILFNDTIRHNIALGRPGATDTEIEQAATHAYAHKFIKEKQHGYDTWVGEKGINISGGQRQRIAIARAVLKNAPILVLDEATNALDTEAERIVQAALEELMQGRTTICIAHRLSTIQRADLIVVVDNGRIVETGTHAELLQKGGLYRKLYELSFKPPRPEGTAEE